MSLDLIKTCYPLIQFIKREIFRFQILPGYVIGDAYLIILLNLENLLWFKIGGLRDDPGSRGKELDHKELNQRS